ncbi:hypothetical protein [Corallococcus terminator]|uniref:Uncharacterized protein n=1 Tax=Corallococcus terminator TaxID=2316733 RepID=A0A3A8J1M5_9BACT|nr:hypothetical protein [Corallococcus terminator]RKG83453.1 hypothetical protein D7V88_24145 [Corallococcus terminator]
MKALLGSAAEQHAPRAEGVDVPLSKLRELSTGLAPEAETRLQRVLEEGRAEFLFAQSRLLEQKRSYEEQLGSGWKGIWLKAAGYPREDLSRHGPLSTAVGPP